MLFKKLSSFILITAFIFTSVLVHFSWAAEVSQDTLLVDLSQIEMVIYGAVSNQPLVERLEYLEKELVGRTLPGTVTNRIKQLKDFIITGTVDDPSVIFKINTAQWMLNKNITTDSLITKIENLENILFGKTSEDVLAIRAEAIFSLCFKEGKPQFEEEVIPGGTLIRIKFLNSVSSNKSEEGEVFNFQVVENIFIEDKLVIPANTQGTGKVLEARKASILARKGKLALEFKSISALDGTPLRLILGEEAKEENKRIAVAVGVGVLGLIIFSNPVGLIAGALVPGKNVKIEEGTEMFLQIEQDARVLALVP
ncbi:MAG: hypothetical protein Kow00103_14510 [Candidatus Caldatribacteriota bacterium]